MPDIDPVVDPAPAPTPQPADPAPQPTPEPEITPTEPIQAEPASYWPEDWRQKYAKDDPKLLKRLERYASPNAALDALFAAQAKISSGQLKQVLKPDASPEELASWREENGIPLEAKDYQVSLPSGRVIGEEDKPLVDEFLAQAHETNMHPDQVNKALDWYLGKQEQVMAEQAARDEEVKIQALAELRQEYGADYQRNLAAGLEIIPEHLRDDVLVARGPDGARIGDNPEVIRWLVGLAREVNPIAAVAPGSGTNAMQSIETEMHNLEALMGDRQSEYWKGPKAATMQARYRQLVEARERGARRA